jgi:hypothetical protein
MRYRDVGVAIFAGVLLVGELLPEHQPYWFDSPHSHVEFPEGTTPGTVRRVQVDSGAATSTASALLYYESIMGKK